MKKNILIISLICGVALAILLILGYAFLISPTPYIPKEVISPEITPIQDTISEASLAQKLIGQGTDYETPYYIFDSKKEGPIVLVEAGIHGDEKAGTYALDRLVYKIKIHSGKLIFFPRMNIPAFYENKRYLNVDLNRVFKQDSLVQKHYEYRLAKEIYHLIGKEKVEYLLTLHESRYLHQPQKVQNYGQTIVFGVNPSPNYLTDWLALINKGLNNNKEIFYPFYSPIEGSSTETLVADYHLKGGFCVETWRGFPMKRRVQLQKKVVLSFLEIVGLKYSL